MNSSSLPPQEQRQRVVRVFVSSTFRDMQEERDELVLKTFPELRKRCRERQVEFVEVDLRWGITEEQSQRGEVLPICLAEIERCRPYFICMLGERYGWVPDMIDPELIQTQEWLEEHREKSVTELEILHGVLRNPSMAGRSYFYFRDPAYLERIPEDGRPDFLSEDPKSLEKLEHLKQRIRSSGLPLRDKYPTPTALGQLILDDLWGAIDREFPEEDIPDPLDREAMEHEAFAQSRAKVYIGRGEYFERLDAHVSGDGPPLVLVGESGVGKSALIACWAERYRKSHAEEFMVLHFIGSSSGSTDYRAIIRRIMGEIKRRYEIDDEIPAAADKQREAFPLWLASASAKGKMILILDALNQLEDIDNARHLGWLPNYFPPNVRVIVSSLPGPSMEALEKRRWPQYEIHGLRPDERRALIEEYLGLYRKSLSPPQLDLIASAPQTSNPLYLRALLDELRIFGIHEELDNRIRHYLQAQSAPDLYEKILERLEEDYEKEYEDLVGDSMSFIWASRRGLYESELLELLGDSNQPISRMIWSPLYLAMEESLVNCSGLLNFFHDYLRQAVEHRYLLNDNSRRKRHLQLADYFAPLETDDRKVDELPWQLERSQQWDSLKDCLTDVDMFLKLQVQTKQYELIGYWLKLEGLGFDLVKSYQTSIAAYEESRPMAQELATLIEAIGDFLRLNARYDGAEPLYRRVLEMGEHVMGKSSAGMAGLFNTLACLKGDQGDYSEAESLYKRALEIEGANDTEDAATLSNLGEVLRMKGDFTGAETLFRRALEIREQLLGPEHPGTAVCLNYLALILLDKGYYEAAEPLFRRALEIRELALGPDHPDTAKSLNNLATLLEKKGDYERAIVLQRRALEIWERVMGPYHLLTGMGLNNLAIKLHTRGNYDSAEPLMRRVLEICERVLGPDHTFTTTSLSNLAELLSKKGDYVSAEALNSKVLEIRERVLGPEHPQTVLSLSNLAATLMDKGDYVSAEVLSRRALEIRERVLGPDHPDTAKSLHNLAVLVHLEGDVDGAERLERRALEIREKVLGLDHPDTATSLISLADLLRTKGDYDCAEPLCRRALGIMERVLGSVHPDTGTAISLLAMLLEAKGVPNEAESLYRRSLKIREDALGPNHPDTLTSLNNVANLLGTKEDYKELLELYRSALELRETKLGTEHSATIQLRFHLALFLRDTGNHDGAKEQYLLILQAHSKLIQRIPELDRIAAICHNELAFHTCVPAKDWEKAEQHYRKAIELAEGIPDPVEAANMELNLLKMYHLSGRPVDVQKAKELIKVIEDAGDARADKKRALLEELSWH